MSVIETKEMKYSKAFKEVYIIVNNFAEELYARIPSSFIKMLKNNMNTNYNISLDEINEQGMMQETKKILSLIYRDFLCDNAENLLKQDEDEIKMQNKKYNNMFEENIEKTYVEEIKQELLIKEKWYNKMLNKIKNIFRKHK